MIQLIADNYRKLGGEIRFDSRVERIVVKNGRAAGLKLQNGEAIDADIVISAADGHSTAFELLGDQYLEDRTRKRFKTLKPFPSYVMVSFGVAREFAGEPELLAILLDRLLHIDSETELGVASYRIFNYDPTLAPQGKTAIVSFIPTYDYDYWARLRATSPERYAEEKRRIASGIIDVFEARYPGSREKIEVVDVATRPLCTGTRITGKEAWKDGFSRPRRVQENCRAPFQPFAISTWWVSGSLPAADFLPDS